MEYIIIGLLILIVVLTVISLFKNINESNILSTTPTKNPSANFPNNILNTNHATIISPVFIFHKF